MVRTACGCLPNRYEFTALNKLSLRSKTFFQRKRAERSEAWRKTPVGAYPTTMNCTALNKLFLRSQTYFQRQRAKRSVAWRKPPAGAYPTATNLRLLINCLCGRKPIFNANERNKV